jgi:hypothetical protein
MTSPGLVHDARIDHRDAEQWMQAGHGTDLAFDRTGIRIEVDGNKTPSVTSNTGSSISTNCRQIFPNDRNKQARGAQCKLQSSIIDFHAVVDHETVEST